jgi:hypothetical protein
MKLGADHPATLMSMNKFGPYLACYYIRKTHEAVDLSSRP